MEFTLSRTDMKAQLMRCAPDVECFIQSRMPKKFSGKFSSEDVLQEVWIAALKGRESFKPDGPESFERWIRRVAANKLTDMIKEAGRAKRGGQAVEAEGAEWSDRSIMDLWGFVSDGNLSPSRVLGLAEIKSGVQAAMVELPARQRQAVRLFYLEDRPLREVASIMDLSEVALNGLVYRARLQLKEIIGDANRFFSSDWIDQGSSDVD